MSTIIHALISLACIAVGSVAGSQLRRRMSEQNRCQDSKDIVKLGTGMVATQVALVIGLLVGSSKDMLDTVNTGLTDIGANVIVLNHTLEQYGPEAREVRLLVRASLREVVGKVWPREAPNPGGLDEVSASSNWEAIDDMMLGLRPAIDQQSSLKARAVQTFGTLAHLRWTLLERSRRALPTGFLVVLDLWLVTMFAGLGFVAPPNRTRTIVLSVTALVMASGVLLILDMSQPLDGFVKAHPTPLLDALQRMKD